MNRVYLLMAVFLATIGQSAAQAQLAPGYSGQSSAAREASAPEYWYMLRQMGACVATEKRDDATAFLATTPGSDAETRVFRKMFGSNRNFGMRDFVSASFIRAHLRGSIAEGLYEGLALQPPSSSPSSSPETAQPLANLHDFARCYVALNAAAAHELMISTRMNTVEERKTVARMASGFAPCLPAGREVSLSPLDVRLALAEALYKRAVGAAQLQVAN